MGDGLRMTSEIVDWLTELAADHPDTAAEVAATLVAAADAAKDAGPPLVTDLSAPVPVGQDGLRYAVDAAYQDLLTWLGMLRQQAADAATRSQTAKRMRVTPQGSEPLPWTEEEIAALRKREADLTARHQRCSRDAEAFHAKKEAAKARLAAASARRGVQLAVIAAVGEPADDDGRAELAEARAELGRAEQELTAATADITALLARAQVLRRKFLSDVAEDDTDVTGEPGSAVPAGLLELSADRYGADIRILCAFEPAGTLTLLSVLEGKDAIREHRTMAIGLAGELLDEIRAEGWPAELGEVTPADTATFLSKFFPDAVATIRRRAAQLAAAQTLASLRRIHGVSLADLAAASGLSEHELWKLETEDLESARLRDVGAYIRALGGRLELTATLGESGPVPLC